MTARGLCSIAAAGRLPVVRPSKKWSGSVPSARMDGSRLLNDAEELHAILVAHATGSVASGTEYRRLRKTVLSDVRTKGSAPPFLGSCRTLEDFWDFIQPKFGTYAERRKYLRDEFGPLYSLLERDPRSPADPHIRGVLSRLDWDAVQDAWQKALDRRSEDPDGAITSARSLLESVCKHILDEAGIAYGQKDDLPKLYGAVAENLRMAPSQHTEKVFKQILGGCHAIVEGLGTLRSRVGDAHGQGKRQVKPTARHAELAVNLAGALATFLTQTWEKTKDGRSPTRT
jgi:hypothetical protein